MMLKAGRTIAPSLVAVILGGSSVAVAGPPSGISFQQWTVNNGDITADCPTDFACGAAVSGKGFFQDMITHKVSGESFFRTIVTEQDVTGDPKIVSDMADIEFFDENYVAMNNDAGIADMSVIFEQAIASGTTEAFYSETVLNTGWASDSGNDELDLYQWIKQEGASIEDFRTDFQLSQEGENAELSKRMLITGFVELDTDAGNAQEFVLSQLTGTSVYTGGSITDLGGESGNSLTWTTGANADVQAVWVGQQIDLVGQEFGFTSYENKTPGSEAFVDTFDLGPGSSSAPLQWDTGFWGEVAVLPPVVITGP